MRPRRASAVTLPFAAILAAATSGIAAVASIDAGLPADWGGFLGGDPDDVLGDFLTWRGTAIAPPLFMIIALGLLATRVPEQRTAVYALAFIGSAGVVGYLGEPATWDLAWPAAFAWVGVGVYGLTAGLAAREVRRDPRPRPVAA